MEVQSPSLSHKGVPSVPVTVPTFGSEARRLLLHFIWFGRIERAFE